MTTVALTRKLKDEEDEDDDTSALMAGPFENTKRKSSWSASSLRKELGSPRMTGGDMSALNRYFEESPLELSEIYEDESKIQLPYEKQGTTKENPPSDSGPTAFLKELGSALVSCSAAESSLRDNQSVVSCHTQTQHTFVAGLARFKNSFHRVVNGDLDAARNLWKERPDTKVNTHSPPDLNSFESHDSIFTHDQSLSQRKLLQQEDEANQLRRLTSWGTIGTFETLETTGTDETGVLVTQNSQGVIEDDDGIPIDSNFLPKKLHNKSARRKRIVRFDYPPITSLRECPRTQPEQIGELFFTEHELEQIEDDRYSTISADDVEIVAISTSTTTDSESMKDEDDRSIPKSPSSTSGPSEPTMSASTDATEQPHRTATGFRNYIATPSKNKREPRKAKLAFSFDDSAKKNGRSNTVIASKRRNSRASQNTASQNSPSARSSNSSRRMIKSVQIYLRERSVG